jgi:hypothetical protein
MEWQFRWKFFESFSLNADWPNATGEEQQSQKLTGLEQLCEIARYLMLILFIVFLCVAIIALVVFQF